MRYVTPTRNNGKTWTHAVHIEAVWCERDSKSPSTVVYKLPWRQSSVITKHIAWEKSWHFPTPATTGFPGKWRLRIERRNSILMTRYYPDQSSGISALVSQTSFRGETCGDVTKCQLFSQVINHIDIKSSSLHISHLWLQEDMFLSLLQHC